MMHFLFFVKSISQFSLGTSSDSIELEDFKLLHTHDVIKTLPNVEFELYIYPYMFVANYTGEQSFLKLKLIKFYL